MKVVDEIITKTEKYKASLISLMRMTKSHAAPQIQRDSET